MEVPGKKSEIRQVTGSRFLRDTTVGDPWSYLDEFSRCRRGVRRGRRVGHIRVIIDSEVSMLRNLV